MLYRAVLIFPDQNSLADFIGQFEVPGETNNLETAFVGNLDEEQIKIACKTFGAYVRVARELESIHKGLNDFSFFFLFRMDQITIHKLVLCATGICVLRFFVL
ncbi:MAG TPA: hypothetical protein VGN63_12360 [Flavisolibacter sp.]|jgi:hypothetical protein|nr:hypothetical protein [Flavisolibacter sp.]